LEWFDEDGEGIETNVNSDDEEEGEEEDEVDDEQPGAGEHWGIGIGFFGVD
jgi:hypothetical protein